MSPPTVASSEDETAATNLSKGLGPRIYVGGIPNALSQTMIKNHFGHYGKVVDVYFPKHPVTCQRQAFCFVTFSTRKAANAAVSQSNRKINGHQVSSIASTADRPMHHRAGQHPSPPSHESAPADVRSQQCHTYAMWQDHISPTSLRTPMPAQSVWPGQTSTPSMLQSCLDLSGASSLHSLLANPLASHAMNTSQAALALLLAANSQGNAAMGPAGTPAWNLGPRTMPGEILAGAPAYLQAAVLANTPIGGPRLHNEEAMLAQHQHLLGFSSGMLANGVTAGPANAIDLMALQSWLGMTEGLYQPAVPSTTVLPNPLIVPMADSEPPACDMCFGYGPLRHNNARDMGVTRHSPY